MYTERFKYFTNQGLVGPCHRRRRLSRQPHGLRAPRCWIARCGARQSHNRGLGGAAGRVVCDRRCRRSIAGRSADRRASGRRHIRDYIHVSDLVAAHSDALAYLRGGGASTTLNCGYGRGFSVLDVIEPVKRRLQGRVCGPPGRRSASLVAACDRIRSTLKWQPRYDDLQTIVTHALA